MIVTVSDTSTFSSHGSVTTAQGLSEDGSQIITFGGDWRVMRDLFEALAEESAVDADIESWQIVRSLPNPEWSQS